MYTFFFLSHSIMVVLSLASGFLDVADCLSRKKATANGDLILVDRTVGDQMDQKILLEFCFLHWKLVKLQIQSLVICEGLNSKSGIVPHQLGNQLLCLVCQVESTVVILRKLKIMCTSISISGFFEALPWGQFSLSWLSLALSLAWIHQDRSPKSPWSKC